MPRPTNRLSAKGVQSAPAGYHADGAGLYLQVTTEGTASWVFRYTLKARKREMGLGSAALFSLADARLRAADQRRLLADGIDPIDARIALRAVVPRPWGEAVDDFIKARKVEWRTDEQAAQWHQSLADYGPDRSMPVAAVSTSLVIELLQKIWTEKTETATRVQGRIARIWDAERVAGNVAGDNPARWRGHLDHVLPRPSKVRTKRHHPAMPFADVPATMTELRRRKGITAAALRFTILTAARTSETVESTWDEFDLKARLWTIPAERMKAERIHVVPLVDEAMEILQGRAGGDRPFPISLGSMLNLLTARRHLHQPYTVHGFRSSFRDWVSETTDFQGEVAEMALAHIIPDETEGAYRRGNLLRKRRDMMDAWAAYLK